MGVVLQELSISVVDILQEQFCVLCLADSIHYKNRPRDVIERAASKITRDVINTWYGEMMFSVGPNRYSRPIQVDIGSLFGYLGS
jgi:hypothetical protein